MNTLHFDFSTAVRPMKPMQSVNNGPAGSKVRAVKGNFDDYAKARIPYARNHDASFFSGYGGEHTVDVHRIFKNFAADENDPSSYVFGPTDDYVLSTVEAGTKVFYRLGASIEHGFKQGTYPPADFHKWARICEHIIRHYNEGWANGYELGIEYWEIWNEPDCRNRDGLNPCWQGTEEQFKELFLISFTYLKEKFPHLKIGGPAICSLWSGRVDALLPVFPEGTVAPDFFSYHWYGARVEDYIETLKEGRRVADKYFGKQTETILNEYNYIRGWSGDNWTYSLACEKGLKGASLNAALMAVSQTTGLLDMLMYYDARPCGMNGMFTYEYDKLKTYYTISAFSDLYELGTQVESENGDSVWTVGAKDADGNGAALVTYYNDDDTSAPKELKLTFSGFGYKVKATYYLIDESHDLTLLREEIFTAETFSAYLTLPLFSTYLIKFERLD